MNKPSIAGIHHVTAISGDSQRNVDFYAGVLGLRLVERGYDVSPVMDRSYFRSIYFREPGGVLFEIATDVPGFAADDPVDQLGGTLMLPAWLEPSRPRIEARLPPLHPPRQQSAAVPAGAVA